MITSEQRRIAFMQDFESLLTKHAAEIMVTDDGHPYGMQSGVCYVIMVGKYDSDGNTVAEYTEFSL